MTKKAFIVGCGQIAGGFNETDESTVLTHIAAYRKLGVPVVGVCDSDPARAAHFAQRWNVPHFGTNLDQLLLTTEPDLISICTPSGARLPLITTALASPSVQSILVEKPLAASAREAEQILMHARMGHRPILVNFFRAFDPFYTRLENACRQNQLSPFIEATARYYGTARANASHWLERLLAMVGPAISCRRLRGTTDAPSFEITFNTGKALFLPTSHCQYSPFELDLLFEKHRVRVIDSECRVEYFKAKPDPKYPGYYTLACDEWFPECQPSPASILLAVNATLQAANGTAFHWENLLARAAATVTLLEELEQSP